MIEMSANGWMHQGSSLVFDSQAIGPLLGKLVSLRTLLSWSRNWPSSPPDGTTILVGGLESILETLDKQTAEDFLRAQLHPFICDLQFRWNKCGLVFGFGIHERAFVVDATGEELRFLRRDGETIDLSRNLWGAGMTLNMNRLVREEEKQTTTLGYHVLRLS